MYSRNPSRHNAHLRDLHFILSLGLTSGRRQSTILFVDMVHGLQVLLRLEKFLVVCALQANAAEHVTSVWMAMKSKMELTIGVCVGSSIVRPFILPFATQTNASSCYSNWRHSLYLSWSSSAGSRATSLRSFSPTLRYAWCPLISPWFRLPVRIFS